MHFWIEKQDPKTTIFKFIDTVKNTINVGDDAIIKIDTSAGTSHYEADSKENLFSYDAIRDDNLLQVVGWLSSGQPYAVLKSISIVFHYERQQLKARLESQADRDQISLSWAGQAPQGKAAAGLLIRFMEAIFRKYDALPDSALFAVHGTQALSSASVLPEQLVHRMSESATLMNHLLVEKTKEVCDTVTDAAKKLRNEADAERAKLHDAHSDAMAQLQKEREAFEAEKKQFDDQKSTLIRRNLLSKINESLEKRGREFKLSKETYKKTWPIQAVCLLLALLALSGIFVFGQHVLAATPSPYHLLPFSTSVVTLLSTAVFYTRWHNQWVSRHADLETRNQLLEYDMLRASWVAEFLLEYKDERGQGLPDSVIQVMTKNLFEGQNKLESATHPAEDMASFITRINRVRLGSDEMEFEADTKGTKKAKAGKAR